MGHFPLNKRKNFSHSLSILYKVDEQIMGLAPGLAITQLDLTVRPQDQDESKM